MQMHADARILEHIVRNAVGVERIEFSWEGGERVEVSYRLMQHKSVYITRRGNLLTIGPYRLRIIEGDPCRATYLCMRDGWKAHLWWGAYRASHILETIYRRLIITAAVWGLGRYVDNAFPTWRDVYMLDWLARKLGR